MIMKKKRTALWWITAINCLVAICALLVKDTVANQSVTKVCTVVLYIAWLIQGAYVFYRLRQK